MNAATIVSIMKPNITSLGYGLFLAINAAGVWGGVFPFLPMEFQTTEIVFWFFLAQSLVFSFSYFASALGSYFFPGPTRTFIVRLATMPYLLGWCCLIAAIYLDAWALPLVVSGGALLGLGSAGFYMLWQRLFASQDSDTGNRDLIKGTLYAAVLYFSLYLIPQAVTAFLIPLVFLPLFGLTIVLKSREIDLDQAMFQDVPRDHPLVYQRLVNDYWRSALCVGALGFCTGIMRSLAIGEPDLNTPDVIKEAAKAALDANDTHYPPGNGYPYALEAISKFEAEAHGLHYAPSEIILTVGATEALFASFSTILNPGDEVIIPTPAFGLYEALVQLQGGVPVSLPTEHNHFQIVPEELKAAITDRTKAIILTSPNNPTGCVYTKETLDAVHAILRDKPIFVLCDDVYRTLTYCEDYHSFAEYQDMRDRIIVVQSFSKPYAMTGWRLGYCMADAKLMDRIQVFHQYCVTSVPSFVQRACVTALETDTSDVVEIFRRRRDYVYQRLVDMGLDVEKPEGAFYMFVDIRKFGMDSNTFCTRMLKEGLVGVIPGIHFGTEGFMRLSYCYSDADLKEGLDRIEKFIKSL